ncbi:MAG: response regulator transcription factor [Candidatus Sumerlaeia bacterium]
MDDSKKILETITRDKKSREKEVDKSGEAREITVYLADDHRLFREGLRTLLENQPTIKVIGEAEDGRTAVEEILRLKPMVGIIDVSMPLLNGLEAVRRIKKHLPSCAILVLSMYKNEEYVYQAFKWGAQGYILKDFAASDLFQAIENVSRGDFFISSSISRLLIEDIVLRPNREDTSHLYESLTAREREIFQLIAEGQRNQEIARQLDISIKTVEAHRANIMTKLRLKNVAELVRYAVQIGIISPHF